MYKRQDYTYYTASDLKMTQNDDGSVYYDVTIRDDLTFSDGTPITICLLYTSKTAGCYERIGILL